MLHFNTQKIEKFSGKGAQPLPRPFLWWGRRPSTHTTPQVPPCVQMLVTPVVAKSVLQDVSIVCCGGTSTTAKVRSSVCLSRGAGTLS